MSQISIQLDDDSWLFCDDTRQFADAPYGPCVLGPNGDVALYATHKCQPGEDFVEDADVRDPHHGDKLTYVPAGKIRRVSLRMLKNTKPSAAGAAELPVEAGGGALGDWDLFSGS